ncbi:hypothetical protein EW145_g6445 [Phellinidium pouzarii]|uniref:UBZ4-type domain-containing protein n=1 Tax=Phellinidium pouzarii TaxID=167371 RepID=A0A4S4KWK4_9AGAM|nr:hypothetical protein EW145_g6445 [Phellinidium pouzarii]
MSSDVTCPACSRQVPERHINQHLDNNCSDAGSSIAVSLSTQTSKTPRAVSQKNKPGKKPVQDNTQLAPIFSKPSASQVPTSSPCTSFPTPSKSSANKRSAEQPIPTPVKLGDMLHPSQGQLNPNKRAKTTASNLENAQPLPERLRPQSLEEFVGQPHLTGPNSLLRNLLETGSSMGSVIFWGPPGCGKTTLARLLAKKSNSVFKELSATDVGIKEVRQVFEEAKGLLSLTGRRTILFLDEVHRFNRAQQDIFLPYVEQGYIQLIGATTENPSFKINGALLSRCRVFVLERLTDDDIKEIITRAVARVSPFKEKDPDSTVDLSDVMPLSAPKVDSFASSQPDSSQTTSSTFVPPTPTSLPFPNYPQITQKVFSSLISLSTGDARTALSLLSLTLSSPPTTPTPALLDSLRKSVIAGYDRTGDTHYDLISALHKSVRGNAGSAALYWLARMLSGGEDPLYIARRMVVCASEDIGLADPQALPLAMATYQACQVIGMPECRINLAHLVSYLSEAPKSTRAYMGYKRAEIAAAQNMTLPVPLHLRNAPTKLMAQLGYAEGYRYNPDYAHPVHNQYLPTDLKGEVFLLKEGDLSDKTWDEDALKVWEKERHGGQQWEGRLPKPAESVQEEGSDVSDFLPYI